MTTEEMANNEIADIAQDLSDAELVVRLGQREETAVLLRDSIQRLECEVIKRLEERNARELYHPNWECKLEKPSPTYDTAKLYAELGENVEPAVWRDSYTPEHPRAEIVPAKFNFVKLNAVARAHGQPITDAMEAARLPSKPGNLKVSRKEQE